MEKNYLRFIVLVAIYFAALAPAAARAQAPKIRAFAVFKVSYLSHNPSSAMGGIAGTAFFTEKNRAFSAYHVMRPELFKPNTGYDRVRVWLVHQKHPPIEVVAQNMRYDSRKDLSAIQFADAVVPESFVFESAVGQPVARPGEAQLSSQGYVVGETAEVTLISTGTDLRIQKVGQLPAKLHQGVLRRRVKLSLKSLDMRLENIPGLELSYGMYVGMSGGPTLIDGRVVGVNSFGFPADQAYKTQAWAVLLEPKDFGG